MEHRSDRGGHRLAQLRIFENLTQNLLAREACENLCKICWLAQNLLARSQCSECQRHSKVRLESTDENVFQGPSTSSRTQHFAVDPALPRSSDTQMPYGTSWRKFSEICSPCMRRTRKNLSKICCFSSKYAHQNLREKKQNP